jgi:hypothetical protein
LLVIGVNKGAETFLSVSPVNENAAAKALADVEAKAAVEAEAAAKALADVEAKADAEAEAKAKAAAEAKAAVVSSVKTREEEIHEFLEGKGKNVLLQIGQKDLLEIKRLDTRGDGFCFFHAYVLSRDLEKKKIPDAEEGIELARKAWKYAKAAKPKEFPAMTQSDILSEVSDLKRRLDSYVKRRELPRDLPLPDGTFWKAVIAKVDEKTLGDRKIHLAFHRDGDIYALLQQGIGEGFNVQPKDIIIGNYAGHFEGFSPVRKAVVS